MGAVDLSMTPGSIPRVRKILSVIDSSDAKRVVTNCLDAATADEVEEIVRREFSERWPELFSPKALPASPDPHKSAP
jgi:phosphoenolpyruvate-protein kinase (PTS system EI component)